MRTVAAMCLGLVCWATPTDVVAQVFLTKEKALALAFPGADVEKETAILTAEQREVVAKQTGLAKPDRIFRYHVGRKGEKVLGYAVLDAVRGKSRNIDYMVVVDAQLAVQRIEVMVFRESHGWEIKHASWRKQFVGSTAESTLRIGRDIENIAGATISCRAVTAGVRRNLSYLAALLRQDTPAPNGPLRRQRALMGTELEITICGSDEAAVAAAFDEVARVESVLSSWRDESALSKMNREAGGELRGRDPLLVDFLVQCRKWSGKTQGAFDATAGPLVALWKRAAETGTEPGAGAIAKARARVGHRQIELDAEAGTARLAAGARLDAGAIGKGYALDRAAEVLHAHGVQSALLNFGGQVLATGPRADGSAWRVRLREADGGSEGAELALTRGSIATTADYERGLRVGRQRFSHVVDPRNGRPAEGLLAVTVFAESATAADALSTALFVMGTEAAAWAEEHRICARMSHDDTTVSTLGFERILASEEQQR